MDNYVVISPISFLPNSSKDSNPVDTPSRLRMLRIMIKPELLVNLQIYRRLRNLNEKEPQESFLTQLGTCTFAVFAKMNMEFLMFTGKSCVIFRITLFLIILTLLQYINGVKEIMHHIKGE